MSVKVQDFREMFVVPSSWWEPKLIGRLKFIDDYWTVGTEHIYFIPYCGKERPLCETSFTIDHVKFSDGKLYVYDEGEKNHTSVDLPGYQFSRLTRTTIRYGAIGSVVATVALASLAT